MEKKQEDCKSPWSGRTGVELSSEHDRTCCHHGLAAAAAVVVCVKSSQTTPQHGREETQTPEPPAINEELWRVAGFLRGGESIF